MQDSLCAMGLFRPYSNRTFYTDNAYLTYRRRSSKVSGFVGCKKTDCKTGHPIISKGIESYNAYDIKHTLIARNKATYKIEEIKKH